MFRSVLRASVRGVVSTRGSLQKTPLNKLVWQSTSNFHSSKIACNSADNSSDVIGSVSSINSVDTSLAAADAATAIAALPEPGFASGLVMSVIEDAHVLVGIPYWEAIVLTTIGLRIALLPIALQTVVGSGRMAVLRPEMQKVQDAMNTDPHISDPRVQQKYTNEMRALFVKHKVNPFRAMLMPLFQLPIFISFFFALKEMGTFYPGFATGGDYWFTNLAAADPYYILPVVNSLSFLIMIELGADGMQVQQKGTFQMAMRGLAVAMIPLTAAMPQGLFMYWCTNNTISIIQTLILKQEPVRNFFNIPKPPKEEDTPALKIVNPFNKVMDAINREKSKGEAAEAEILGKGAASVPKAPPGPPVTTFSHNPKRVKKETPQ